MIEKILERLESSYHVNFNFHIRGDYRQIIDAIYDEVFKIVQEVAMEYGSGWIPTERELPPHSDNLLLVQCSGKPRKNITLENAFELASYTEEGWVFQMYPVWDDAEVVAWMELPAPYQKGE